MKKTISVVLFMAMLLTLCVPAFAAQLDKDNATGTVLVQTLEQDASGNDGASYYVTIPADTQIPWGETDPVDLSYAVEAHLRYAEQLKVTVAGSGAMTYVASAEDTYTLAYTLDGVTEYLGGPVVYGGVDTPAVEQDLTVTIAEADWGAAVVGTYSDTLTFTAEIV